MRLNTFKSSIVDPYSKKMTLPKAKPQRLAKIIQQTKQYEQSLGYEKFRDPKVNRFIKLMNPIRKSMIESEIIRFQNDLYMNNNIDTKDFKKNDISKVGKNVTNAIKFLGTNKPRDDTSPMMISTELFNREKAIIFEKYKEMVQNSSIMLFIEDISDTITDINYENKVIKPIKKFDMNDDIVFKNVDARLFQNLLKEPTLRNLIGKVQSPEMFNELDLPLLLKVICISQSSIEFSTEIIKILQKEKANFKLFMVHINIERSPKIAKELTEVMKGYNDRTITTSYEALLNKAKESHSTTNITTRKLLTMIGESGLLKVITDDKSVSFTQHLDNDGDIDGEDER